MYVTVSICMLTSQGIFKLIHPLIPWSSIDSCLSLEDPEMDDFVNSQPRKGPIRDDSSAYHLPAGSKFSKVLHHVKKSLLENKTVKV